MKDRASNDRSSWDWDILYSIQDGKLRNHLFDLFQKYIELILQYYQHHGLSVHHTGTDRAAMASSSFQHPAAVKSQESCLLSITAEIRQRYLVPGVHPYERNRSPKTSFIYTSKNVLREDGEYNPEPLTTALSLGVACRQLYDEVIPTSLF